MKEIYFVRHGETEFNKLGIVQGSGVDSSLNETGLQQAKAFFDYYGNLDFEIIYISALKRTRETVQNFIGKKIPTEEWKNINEICWGDSEGKESTPESRQEYLNMRESWSNGDIDAKMPGGESARELMERLTQFIEHLKTRPEKKILVCTHGRTLRCMMMLLKGEHPRAMEQYKHSNTGLFKVNFDGEKFDVELENDTRHLT